MRLTDSYAASRKIQKARQRVMRSCDPLLGLRGEATNAFRRLDGHAGTLRHNPVGIALIINRARPRAGGAGVAGAIVSPLDGHAKTLFVLARILQFASVSFSTFSASASVSGFAPADVVVAASEPSAVANAPATKMESARLCILFLRLKVLPGIICEQALSYHDPFDFTLAVC